MKIRLRKYFEKKQDQDIINLVNGIFNESCKSHGSIPLACICLIVSYWNAYDIEYALEFKKLRKTMKMRKVPHATTWINIKQHIYKIAIKFGQFQIVNLYPSFGKYSVIDCKQSYKKICTSTIVSSENKKEKWIVPPEYQNKSIKIVLEFFYPNACKTCKSEFGSQSHVEIWIFHSGFDLNGGFVTKLNMSNSIFKSDEIIDVICWEGKIHVQQMFDVYKCFCYGWEIENEEHWRNKLCI